MSRLFPAMMIAYAVGSLPIGYLVAQWAGGVDLRHVGSGNVGATNLYRTTVLSPVPTLFAAGAFAIVVARSRFVSLGSMVATVVLLIAGWLTPGGRAVEIGASLVAALILFRHRGNIMRLMSGTEWRLGR